MSTLQAAREAMGTRFELVLQGDDREHLQAVADEALAEVERLDARWSVFRPDSDLAHINRQAAQRPVRLDGVLFDLLVRARRLVALTRGAFDPAVGSLMHPWRLRGEPHLTDGDPNPTRADRPPASGLDSWVLDPSQRQVRFLQADLQLDLGAIAKGYAVDVAAEICREAGVDSGLIHAGTSSVYAWGEAAPGVPWQIGIPTVSAARQGRTASDLRQSERQSELLTRVTLQNAALGVSAPWGRQVAPGTKGCGHILHPESGRPATEVDLAVVIAPQAEEADALSTALVVGGEPLQQHLSATRPGWRSLIVLSAPASEGPRIVRAGLDP